MSSLLIKESIGKGRFRLAFRVADRWIGTVTQNEFKYVPLKHGDEYEVVLFNDGPTRADAEVKIDGRVVGNWRIPPEGHIFIERPIDIQRKFQFFKEGSTEGKAAGIAAGEKKNGVVEVHFQPEQQLAVRSMPMAKGIRGAAQSKKSKGSKGDISPPSFAASDSDLEEDAEDSTLDDLEVRRTELSVSRGPSDGRGERRERGERGSTSATEPRRQFASGATVLGQASAQRFTTVEHLRSIDKANEQIIIVRLVVEERPLSPIALSRAIRPSTPPRLD